MLKTLELKNFQGHKNSTIDLSSPVVFIKGPNNANKSGIFWALNTVLYGEDFSFDDDVRWGEKDSTITLEFEDGRTISRYRSKSANQCTIFGEEKVTYETIRSSQGLIQDFTGFREIDKKTPQMVKLESDQFYMVLGVSDATRMKWVQNLVGGNLLQQTKDQLEKELRIDQSSLKAVNSDFDKLIKEEELYNSFDLQSLLQDANQIEELEREIIKKKIEVHQVKSVDLFTPPEIFDDSEIYSLDILKISIEDKKFIVEQQVFKLLDNVKTTKENLIKWKEEKLELERNSCPYCGAFIENS